MSNIAVLLTCTFGGATGADRSGDGQMCLVGSVSGWDYRAAIRLSGIPHGVFGRGGLPPNNRYRDRVTPVSGGTVKKSAADSEDDGLEEPDLTAGKRKGMCCTSRA